MADEEAPAARPQVMPIFMGAPWAQRYGGPGSELSLQDWKAQTEYLAGLQGLSAAQRVQFVLGSLEGEAKREVLAASEATRATAKTIFDFLFGLYGDSTPVATLRAQFFNYKQGPTQTLRAYSLKLREQFGWLKGRPDHGLGEGDDLLRDQFVLGLREGPVRQGIRLQLRRDPTMTFEALRQEALALELDQGEVTRTPVCVAASSASGPAPVEPSDWKQKLRAELLEDVKGQMAELSRNLLGELRRGRVEGGAVGRERSYSEEGRGPLHRPLRPVGPRFQGFLVPPATVGQVAGTPLCDPLSVPVARDDWVGHCPTVEVQANGVTIDCLVDTGSQVTLFSESLAQELFADHRLQATEASRLTLRGANGLDIPYTGYIVVDFLVQGVPVQQKGVVIVRDHCLGNHRALLGMNVILDCWEELFRGPPARMSPSPAKQDWDRILADCKRVHAANHIEEREDIGRVACRYALSIPAQSETVLWVRVPARPRGSGTCVLVEPHEDCQPVEVAHGLAVVHRGRVSVKVRNTNPYPVLLRRHQRLARVSSVRPAQVHEHQAVCFRQVSPAVVEVAVRPVEVELGSVGGGMPAHLMGESLKGENLEEEQVVQLQELLRKWQHVFSKHEEDYGCTGVVKHQIPTGEATPSRERYRPVPPTLYTEVRTLLKGMLEGGIIRESSSPWAAPIVLVQKKTGAWRFCVDYRKLNSVTKKDAFPLPRIEDSLTSLTQAAWYSTLDLASGYWQVQVDDRDREKTAFTTPFGLFEWDRMPFGLCNAPATFQRLMQRCLGGQLVDSTLVYLDDVIVFSPDFHTHLHHLEGVFRAMEKYGLKLRPEKCQLLRKEVQFLGHRVSAVGISPDPEKVAAVQGWEPPRTVRQVRSFLGFVGYYRRFIKGFSGLAKPLNQLLAGTGRARGKGSPSVHWDSTCETAFQNLKQELLKAPILAYADFTQPFLLYTDASNAGLGAVLAQEHQGVERVIAYASRSLHPAERNAANYSSFKIELLAMKWAMTEKFKDYLWGAKVTVITDNNPLVHLQSAKLGAVEQRWVAQLANYDYQLKYRPGREHVNADALSRLPATQRDDQAPLGALGTEDELLVAVVEAPGAPESVPSSWGWDPGRWRELQQRDADLGQLLLYLRQGNMPRAEERRSQTVGVRQLLRQWKRLQLREGVICRSRRDPRTQETVHQVVVPEGQVSELLNAYHTHTGHQGQERTLSLLRRYFHWPRMEKKVEEFVQSCPRCTLFKRRKEVRAPLVPLRPKAPLHIVGIDFLTLGRPTDRFQNILVMTDLFTKYAWAVPTVDQTAVTTANALWRAVIQPFGCPETLHSDQGSNFESRVIQELSRLYGCRKTHTTSYHPQGNGGCERFNQTLLGLLGTLESEQQGQWAESLPSLLQAYNNSVHSVTGYAPSYLMFGRHLRLPVDLLMGTEAVERGYSTTDWVNRHHHQLLNAYRRVSDHLSTAAAKNKRLYDRTAREAPLLPGERVLVWDNRRPGKGKLSARWESTPYVVEQRQGPDAPVYSVRPEGKPGPIRVLHRNLLRPCPNYPQLAAEAPSAPPALEAPMIGWAVVPRDPEVEARAALPSPPRRSQRNTRGQPPERYGEWN
ncbi:interleukin-1 receptor accessory protein-like 1-A [Pimephales promelas]|nr:interleukin-1 receptor accessory protein-like 1-A [Pimephales promelas]